MESSKNKTREIERIHETLFIHTIIIGALVDVLGDKGYKEDFLTKITAFRDNAIKEDQKKLARVAEDLLEMFMGVGTNNEKGNENGGSGKGSCCCKEQPDSLQK